MPGPKRTKRPERCVFKESGRRCVRNGSGNPPLCRPHQIAFAEQARRAAEPQGPARRAANGFRDIVEDLLNGRGFNSQKAATTITEAAWAMGGGYGAFHPDLEDAHPGHGHFEPPQDFHPPPNWGQREPIRPPTKDPAIEREARRELGFGPSDPLTEDVIKERRRILARKHHPDRGGSVAKMQTVNNATEVLLASLETT